MKNFISKDAKSVNTLAILRNHNNEANYFINPDGTVSLNQYAEDQRQVYDEYAD